MAKSKLTAEEKKRGLAYLTKLHDKYESIGQDFFDYLEGLLHSKGLKYWEYIQIDALHGLQIPKTNFPDEVIFITYHQITELYFKLIKHELSQLVEEKNKEFEEVKNWHKRIARVNNYMRHLCSSFDIMKTGMDPFEFRLFRMALLPASGFQAVSFRHIEIMSTNLLNLLSKNYEPQPYSPAEEYYDNIYWKGGGIVSGSGKKTLTLTDFEEKYDRELLEWIEIYRKRNLAYLYENASAEIKKDKKLKQLLKSYDEHFNIFWKLSHLMASGRHLPKEDTGTGGTNWRKYLPPKFQSIHFFPTIWTAKEKKEWGKTGILKEFKNRFEKNWMKE